MINSQSFLNSHFGVSAVSLRWLSGLTGIKNGFVKPEITKPGLILPFALCSLVIMALLGFFLMINARSEIILSRSASVNQETLNFADSTALISTLATRILLHPELGTVSDVLTSDKLGEFPVSLDVNPDTFTLFELYSKANSKDYFDRYLNTGWLESISEKPDLLYKIGSQDIALAVVNLDTRDPIMPGDSIGVGNSYDTGSESQRYVTIVVSTRGRKEVQISGTVQTPATIITSMYREGM
jgi:hypothetical protein